MKETLKSRIEVGANVSIIILALLICSVFMPRLWSDRNEPNGKNKIAAGKTLPLSDYQWTSAERHLLLVLSTNCRFCSESAGFYERLAVEANTLQKVKLIGVFPQSPDQARAYLKSIGVSLNKILQVPMRSIGVMGTPTIILTDIELNRSAVALRFLQFPQ